MFIAANWKMNLSVSHIFELQNLISDDFMSDKVEMCIFPQHPLLYLATEKFKNSDIKVGSQTCHSNILGSFTGDVSAQVLADLGCKYCIVGHSERRHHHYESNDFIKNSVDLLLDLGITPILCIGETLELKQKNKTNTFLKKQLKECIPSDNISNIIVAYEPLWAIGTGVTPDIDEIFNVNNTILNELSNIKNLKILYGGSVSLSNCSEIFKIENVNGALIGGASLNFKDFLAIYKTAVKQVLNREYIWKV